jgi:hypothetical protein
MTTKMPQRGTEATVKNYDFGSNTALNSDLRFQVSWAFDMAENAFLNERGILVTDHRIVVNKKTFSISGITSVEMKSFEPGAIKIAVYLILGTVILGGCYILSSLFLALSLMGSWLGWIVLLIGIILFLRGLFLLSVRKGSYSIITSVGISKETILTSPNQFFVKKVYRAINQALAESRSA